MSMSYSRMEIPREIIREELADYLRTNSRQLRLSTPSSANSIIANTWLHAIDKVGKNVSDVVQEIYKNLRASGKVQVTQEPVNDSIIQNAFQAYYPLRIRQYILEELMELIRMGVGQVRMFL